MSAIERQLLIRVDSEEVPKGGDVLGLDSAHGHLDSFGRRLEQK